MPYLVEIHAGIVFVWHFFWRQPRPQVSVSLSIEIGADTHGVNSTATTISSGTHLVDASIEMFLLRAIPSALEYADSSSCCACGARFSCIVLSAEVAKPMMVL